VRTEGLPAADELIAKRMAYLWSDLSHLVEPADLRQSLVYA
jgi:hypothetical protein